LSWTLPIYRVLDSGTPIHPTHFFDVLMEKFPEGGLVSLLVSRETGYGAVLQRVPLISKLPIKEMGSRPRGIHKPFPSNWARDVDRKKVVPISRNAFFFCSEHQISPLTFTFIKEYSYIWKWWDFIYIFFFIWKILNNIFQSLSIFYKMTKIVRSIFTSDLNCRETVYAPPPRPPFYCNLPIKRGGSSEGVP